MLNSLLFFFFRKILILIRMILTPFSSLKRFLIKDRELKDREEDIKIEIEAVLFILNFFISRLSCLKMM